MRHHVEHVGTQFARDNRDGFVVVAFDRQFRGGVRNRHEVRNDAQGEEDVSHLIKIPSIHDDHCDHTWLR